MRITIIALGSRGDVQPYIALGQGLKKAGHTIRLATHENFESLITDHALDFWPVQGNAQAIAETPEMRELLEKGNFIAITARTAKEARGAALHWARDGLAACQGMDLIITGIGGMFIGLALAEKLDIPLVQAHYAPLTPTTAFPGVLFPADVSRLGGTVNYLSHRLIMQFMWQGARSADNAVRRQVLSLAPASFWGPFKSEHLTQTPILYGFSPTIIPKPDDWGDHIHITGYWFAEEPDNWSPPPALAEFLQGDDPPPVYIGFGSMGSRKPEETAELVLQALKRTGQRAVMHAGWGGMHKRDLPDTVIMIDSVPHAWLFPRMAAVVHHGGAGTTAASLRAGVPTLIIPFFADQPFWGQRVVQLGVGPKPIPRKQLTVDNLAQAVEAIVTDQQMHARATHLGVQIQAEDGVARAVEVIQNLQKVGKTNLLT